MAEPRLSKVPACRSVRLLHATFYRGATDRSEQDAPVIEALNALISNHPRWVTGQETGLFTRTRDKRINHVARFAHFRQGSRATLRSLSSTPPD